jgi:DnaD/phage-associated family protein
MNQFWKERYFNRKNWILDENYRLDLNALETLVVLNIEHFNEFNLLIDLGLLANACHSTQIEIDKVLTKLINKGYLRIEMVEDKVIYNTDGLYLSAHVGKDDQSTDIIEIYENEFKRPLSATEIDKLNYWLSQLDYAFLVHALREAAIYRKLSFSYIERILIDWTKNKITLEQLNSGKRNDR